MSEEQTQPGTAIVVHPQKSVVADMAERFGMEPGPFEVTIRATVFREGTREEFAAFLLVAKEYTLNPLTKEIYAFKAKGGGIVPVVSIDGWVSLCNRQPTFDGMSFEDHHDEEGKLYAITCTIFRKDRSHPTIVTEYLEECKRATEPWKMQHRMLRHKSMIQCARYAFGFSGIVDPDEAEQITVTAVRDEPKALTDGPEPQKRPRKPRGGPASADTGDAAEGPSASQEAAGGGNSAEGEVTDAEFEDRPTSPEADTATDGAPAAESEPDTSGPATSASDDGAETSASGPSAGQDDGEPAIRTNPEDRQEQTRAATTAPAGELYTLASDEPDPDDGRIPTYKDGVLFSRVKPDAKARPAAYDLHAPKLADRQPEPEPKQDDPPPRHDVGTYVADTLAHIGAAGSFLAAKQAHKTAAAAPGFAGLEASEKAAMRHAVWTRYAALVDEGVENGDVTVDFTLMRVFLEFGARSVAEIDAAWPRFWKGQAYTSAPDGDKRALNDLLVQRKADLS